MKAKDEKLLEKVFLRRDEIYVGRRKERTWFHFFGAPWLISCFWEISVFDLFIKRIKLWAINSPLNGSENE